MADAWFTDPLGRTIVLHDRTWYEHIVKGHPNMRPERASVEVALQSTSSIRFSASDPDCRPYYSGASRHGVLVAVVADVARGFVKTAYRTLKPKWTVEWSR